MDILGPTSHQRHPVIPKPVREALGLEAGTTLHLETIEGDSGTREITLRPERENSPFRKKGDGDVCVYIGRLIDDDLDVVQLLKEQRETRARHLAGEDPTRLVVV